MLQKVLVVLVGLVMSVLGALSPDQLAASNQQDGLGALGADVADETLATIRVVDGQAFARVPVLWVEVDGQRVSEDAWGSGRVDELRFKVGVKGVDGVAMRVGADDVELHPTDVITIRMFQGDFAYRGLGTNLASLQLQGTVKSTTVRDGAITNKVRTETSGFDLRPAPGDAPAPEDGKVAYVVLTTGKRVDTVAIDDGGARLFTEEAATASAATGEPGNLLAKWVKLDGRLVREYTWGDGPLSRIEFEPADGAQRSVVVAFNGESAEIASGERVVVTDFVGEYLVYQVAGGMMRVRLDGYAGNTATASASSPLPVQVGAGAPSASFTVWPPNPRTTDTVRLNDTSEDDGVIVYRQWSFGDNSTSILQQPTHRFAKPGPYTIRLNVTDNDLQSSVVEQEIYVRNAAPVSDFDFAPKIVTTDTVVAFTDHSYDSDGVLTNWTWDFGDGNTSHTRHPTHRFARGGNLTVTLTTVDELGEVSRLSKVVVVRNTPPMAAFAYESSTPTTQEMIQFIDRSSDADGHVVSWNWSFGDGSFASGSAPQHAYTRPGLYTVALTVVDDANEADTASTQVLVRNRPPIVDFNWTPRGAPAGSPIQFTSNSSDPDGVILLTAWDFGDGTPTVFGTTVSHTFARAGAYPVKLTVTDATLQTANLTRSVAVENSAPIAGFTAAPSPVFRGMPITLVDTSRDPDGDPIASRTWTINGTLVSTSASFVYTFSTLGDVPVNLTVTDNQGHTSWVERTVRVLNRPPVVSATAFPTTAIAGEPVFLNATAIDPDSGLPVSFRWDFGDGSPEVFEQNTTHVYDRGDFRARVLAVDADGALSTPAVLRLRVDYALPKANFTWTPQYPTTNTPVQFSDLSTSANGAIREWQWRFNDDSTDSVSTRTSPTHVFTRSGVYLVSLEVTDVKDKVGFAQSAVLVNSPPEPRFSISPGGIVPLGGIVLFNDTSTDPDNNITEWRWDFGDGTNSTQRFPSHAYTAPGAYPVRLTVKDEYGASATSDPKIVDVANTPPLARWTYTTGGYPQATGVPIDFIGGADSLDPDGTPIRTFTWEFGDNTGPVLGANVTHVFPRSGRFTVGLTAHDGITSSRRDDLSHKELTIQPNHPILVDVEAVLPDGRMADLLGEDYDVELRVMGGGQTTTIGRSAFVVNGSAVEGRLDPAVWVHGDTLFVIVRATFLSSEQSQLIALRDDTGTNGPLRVRFNLRVPVGAEIAPDTRDSDFLLDEVLGPPERYGNDPLYTSLAEGFHGTGILRFADGTPARDTDAQIEVRWVPLRQLSAARNATSLSESSSSLLHWCPAGGARSGVDGTFTWSVDGESTCYLNTAGLYPVGRWEVRARPQSLATTNVLSPIRAIYVDPTGGLLLSSTLGLA